MKKFVSLLMAVMFLFTMLGTSTVFAAEYDLSTLENGYLAANLFSARNEMSYTSGGLPMNFKAEGSWLEFTVTAPAAGLYDVSAKIGAYACTATLGISVDGGAVKKLEIAHYGSSSKDFTIAPVYFTQGAHTVKIECVDRPDNETNVYPIRGLYFVLNSEDEITAQSQGYSSACEGITHQGSGILSFQPTHYAEYEIGVTEESWYKVYALVGATAQWGINIAANGTEADKISDGTTGFSDKQKFEIGKIKLNSGVNNITVTNNRGTAVYFYGIVLEKTSNAIELESLENGFLAANKYSSLNAATEISGSASMNLAAAGSWLEYEVNAPANGLYDVAIRLGAYACTGTYGVSVDGGSVKKMEAANYSGSSKNFAVAPIYLTEGDHKVKVECVSRPETETNEVTIGGLYFTLNDGNEISAQSQGYSSACEGITHQGSGILSFQPTHYTEYEIGVSETAYYKAYVLVGASAQWGLNLVANEGEAYETSGDKIYDGTTGFSDKQKFEMGKIRLFEGQNKIKVTNNRGTAVYFYGIVLEKLSTELTSGATTEISAPSYTSAYSALGVGDDKVQYDIGNENGKLSFQYGDFAEYDVISPEEGEYQLKLKFGAPHDMAVNVLINNTDSYDFSLDATGSYTTPVNYDGGQVLLKAGRNTIKITNTLSGCYFNSFVLSQEVPELTAFSEMSAMEYNIGGQNVSYYDTTLIGGIEKINEDTAVELVDSEWFKYDVEIPSSGKYGIRLSVAADDTDEKTIKITVNDGEAQELTVALSGASAAEDFVLTDMVALDFAEGINTIKIECVSGTWYMDKFCLYQPQITFVDANGAEVTEVSAGTMGAKAIFGGLMIDENVDYYLAVYEVNEKNQTRLIGIDAGNTTISEATVLEMEIDGIEKNENCTYTAKVFVWSNMAGAVYPIN